MTHSGLTVNLAIECDWQQLPNNVTGCGAQVVFVNCAYL